MNKTIILTLSASLLLSLPYHNALAVEPNATDDKQESPLGNLEKSPQQEQDSQQEESETKNNDTPAQKTLVIPVHAEIITKESKIPEGKPHKKQELPTPTPIVSSQQGIIAKTWSAITETRPQKSIRTLKSDTITPDNEDQTVNTITWGISDIVEQMNKAEKTGALDTIIGVQEALKNTEFPFAELKEIISLCMEPKVKIDSIQYRRIQLRENQITNLLILLDRWDQIEFKRVQLVLAEALHRFNERAQVQEQLFQLSLTQDERKQPNNDNRSNYEAIVKTIINREKENK